MQTGGQNNIINGESSKREVASKESDLKTIIISGMRVYATCMHVLYLNSKIAYFSCNYSKVGI